MKKYWWVILLIVLVIVGVLIYFVSGDLKEEERLLAEMDAVYELMNTHNTSELNKKLDKIITTGDYAVVEKAAKNYTKDLYNTIINISDILDDDRIMSLTTYENYENDGPNFIESKAYIIETKEKLENYKNIYQELYTKEKANSYLEKNLDSYYLDFYHQIIGEEDNKEVIDNIEEIVMILNNSLTVLNFLVDNQDFWTLENEMISFDNEQLSNQYNELILKIVE